jgi:4-hydroxy-tetrahydrodipicolinate synthase
MLYNNPPAYKTDFVAEQIAELAAEFPNLEAVKESSGDVRRVMAIRALVGDRLTVLVGLDDAVVEGVQMGAQGWIGGLTNAFPRESVALFEQAVARYQGGGDRAQLDALYRWFLPLLRLDTLPKFVQLIKLAQELVGRGSARVRPPRLELVGAELDAARQLINTALEHRPQLT